MRKYLFFILFLLPLLTKGTHIVGGEIEILHVEDSLYNIRLIIYFDVVNGNPEARDSFANASIFRKRDSVFVDNVFLPLTQSTRVEYTNPSCSNDQLVTDKIIYQTNKVLDPDIYDDEGGYYIIWERCCRNNIVNNIVRPDQTGQTFTVTFPPLKRDGERFINSSPQLFPPLSDYACVDQFYYVDFRAQDADGDSLVYSLASPLNSSEFSPVPTPTPGPHPKVTWLGSYSEEVQIQGDPNLSISDDGFITVRPSISGLFVFSVLCEEYRDGEKIGEVRRDFQLLVIDCPDPGAKPEIFGKAPGSTEYQSKLDKVTVTPTSDKCFEFAVIDTLGDENISIKSISTNFDQDINHLFDKDSVLTLAAGDTAKFEMCLDECPLNITEPALIDIITLDNTCPLPLQDTLSLEIEFKDYNKPPLFTNPNTENVFINVQQGDILNLPIQVVDQDGDSIDLEIVPINFDPEKYNISLNSQIDQAGLNEQNLYWDTNCEDNAFDEINDFQFMLVAEDRDDCELENPRTVIYNVHVTPPQNKIPELRVNGSGLDRTLDIKIEDLLELEVVANDEDVEDSIMLRAEGVGFDLAEFEMIFDQIGGKSEVSQDFVWDNQCGLIDLLETDTLTVRFIAKDKNPCKMSTYDTVTVHFNILPPDNTKPLIFVNGEISMDTFDIRAGKKIEIGFSVRDNEGDSVFLNLVEGGIYKPLIDQPVDSIKGLSNINDVMIWNTSCDLLKEDFTDSTYTFKYVVRDNKCYVPKSDTVTFSINIHDLSVDYDFFVPNAFTPNSEDDINRAFYIPDLPENNCFSQFEKIIIYNRWGKEVFLSTNRDFQWKGVDLPTGVYYYTLIYSHKIFKGHISLIK